MDEAYFFDSYALIEIIKGNARYAPFTKCFVITTKLNLFEVYYYLLKENKKAYAKRFIDSHKGYCIDFDELVLQDAAEFKFGQRRKDVSMVDAMGYTLARTWGMKFLTGDEQFRGLDEVEFVK